MTKSVFGDELLKIKVEKIDEVGIKYSSCYKKTILPHRFDGEFVKVSSCHIMTSMFKI